MIGTGTALALAGAGATLGGAAGAMGNNTTQTGTGNTSQNTSSTSGINLSSATNNEQLGNSAVGMSLQDLIKMTQAGPGQSDVSAGAQSQRDFAAMLGEYAKTGGMPGQGDIDQSNGLASMMFKYQQTALGQSFEDQQTQANRQAALSGRSLNDPILRAKLAQEQTRQKALLDAQQGGYGAQLAMALPGQRLGYAEQRTGIMSGLATQAMQNRAALLSLGSGIQNDAQNFRLNSGTRFNNSSQTGYNNNLVTQGSGGGWGGAISGALGGAGMGLGVASALGGFGSNTGGGGQTGGFANNSFFNQPNPYAGSNSSFGAIPAPQTPSFSGMDTLGHRNPFSNNAFQFGGAFGR